MPAKKCRVKLSEVARQELTGLLNKGRLAARKQTHARTLLQCDESGAIPIKTDQDSAEALNISTRSIERVRQRFMEEGLESALNLKNAVEHIKTPFALSQSKGGRGFDMLTKWVGVWKPLMVRQAHHERFPHASTDFFRLNPKVQFRHRPKKLDGAAELFWLNSLYGGTRRTSRVDYAVIGRQTD